MSGVAEASAIIGIIAGVVALVDAIIKICDAAGDTEGLPAAFREVAQRLPLVQDTLRIVEAQLRKNPGDQATRDAIRGSIDNAKIKAEQLQVIFNKCVPVENSQRYVRYIMALRSLGKGYKVETLMKDLLGILQDIANSHTMRAATHDQVEKLAEALEAVDAVSPSVPDELIEESSIMSRNVHNGQGDIYSANGQAEQYNFKDNARNYKASVMNFGKD